MTKKDALSVFDGRVVDCAKALGITHSAVCNWPESRIPPRRRYEIIEVLKHRKLQPDWCIGMPEPTNAA